MRALLSSLWQQLISNADPEIKGLVALFVAAGGWWAWQRFAGMTAKQFAAAQPVMWGGGALVVAAAAGFAFMAYRRNLAEAANRRVINDRVAQGPTMLLLPRSSSNSVDPESVQVWDRILSVLPAGEHAAWEITGNADGLQFSLHASAQAMPALLSQVMTEWPDSEQRPAGQGQNFHDPVTADGSHCAWIEIGPAGGQAAIRAAAYSVTQAVLTELSRWPDDCLGVLQILARPDAATAATLKAQAIQARNATSTRGPGQAAVGAGTRADSTKQAKEMEARGERAFAEAVIRVAAHAPNDEQAQARAMALLTAVRGAFDQRAALSALGGPQTGEAAVVNRHWLSRGRPWSAGELAVLAHLPGKDVIENFPRLQTAAAQYRPTDPALRAKKGEQLAPFESQVAPLPPELKGGQGAPRIILGTAQDKAGRTYFCGVPPMDWTTHGFVIGSTGSGKSTLLKNLAVQAYALGSTVFLIDPHGKLADDTAAAMPEGRLGDTVVLDMSAKCPPALPLFSNGIRYGLDDAVQAALEVFRTADPANWDQSAQMQEVLSSAVRCLLAAEGVRANVPQLDRLFSVTQGVYRDEVLNRAARNLDAERAARYWQDRVVPALDPEAKRGGNGDTIKQSLGSAARRFTLLMNHKYLRRGLGLHPFGPVLDVASLLDSGGMVVVPVRKEGPDGLGDKAWGVVLTLYMWSVYKAAMGRDWGNAQLALVILDELASMNDLALGDYAIKIMAEARKFKVGGIWGTQSIGLLGKSLAEAIRVNTNQKTVLKVSNADEARAAVNMLSDPSLAVDSVLKLPKYSGYCANLVGGATLPPALIKMLDEITLTDLPPRAGLKVPVQPFRPSVEFGEVMRLAPALARSDPKDPNTAGPVVAYLMGLGGRTLDRVTEDTQALGGYLASWMLNDLAGMQRALADDTPATARLRLYANRMLEAPDKLADRGQRAVMISGGFYGLPWWLREAVYRRETAGRVAQEDDAGDQGFTTREDEGVLV